MSTLLMMSLSAHNYFEIGALTASVLVYARLRGTAFRLFPFFLFFIVVVELTGRYMRIVLKEHNGWVYNIGTTAEFIFYAYIFGKALQNKIYKRLASQFMLFYPLAVLLNLTFIQGFLNFHSYTMVLGSFFMIIFCCLFFYEVFLNPLKLELHREPMFWISTGILFFYLGDFSYNLWYPILTRYGLDAGRNLFLSINNNLNLVLYTCFIIAFLCQRSPRRSLSP
ncbi:MAG TPA: hypothetical protein VK563_14820 [Puia sp.]|nr:hypothetical protein [Puia sp.]